MGIYNALIKAIERVLFAGRPPAPGPCFICGEQIADGDRVKETVLVNADGARWARQHVECQALAIVGHQFGVCSCTGFEQDRAAALELWKRMAAASPETD